MKYLRTIVISLLFAGLAAAVASAAGPDQKPDVGKGRGKLENRVHAYMVARLVDELKLDNKTESSFMGLMRRYFDEKKTLTRQQFDILQSIREGLKSKDSDEKLKSLIEDLEKNRVKHTELEAKFFRDLRRELTPRQQAQLVVVWPQLQQEVRDWLEGVRARRGNGAKAMRKFPRPGAPPATQADK